MVEVSRTGATRRASAGALPHGLRLIASLLMLVVTAAACSSAKPAGATQPPATSPTSATSSAAVPTSSSPAASGGLTGTWSGQYGGAYQGTFTLTWQQSDSKLTGTIELSSLGGNVPINGTVQGNSISFGTVGSTAIQYSGSVSGDSMSGTYKVQSGGGSTGGSWSATRSA